MGSPEIARTVLEALHTADYPISLVMTQPDKPAGRGQHITACACAQYAREKNLSLFQPAKVKDDEVIAKIENLKPDFIVVIAYGKLLPQRVLDAPKIACVNLHASLLPEYRGAAPINWAIIDGKSETGMSLMKITLEMDSGPVYSQLKVPIEEQDNTGALTKKLAQAGAELILRDLPKIAAGSLKATEQDTNQVTYARILEKEDGRIDWNQSAASIHRKIRGLNPWPVAFTSLDNKSLKIYDSRTVTDKVPDAPGTIYLTNQEGIHISTGNGALCITELQLEGKKRLPAREFVNGYRLKVGTIL